MPRSAPGASAASAGAPAGRRAASRQPESARAPRNARQATLEGGALRRATRALRRRDPVLGELIARIGPCRLERRGHPYASLLRSVLYQQLAGSAARAIDRRFRRPFGYRYPSAPRLLATPDARLRQAGLSRQKIAAVKAVARAFAEGHVSGRRLAGMDDAAVVEAVTQIRGIGEWTAHMLLMFSLGRPDVLPVGDYGVRKGAMLLYGLAELPKRSHLEELAAPWRPWRSVASWYLWRATEA